MKAKNIILIFLVNYFILVIVCAFAELWFIADNAKHVQLMVRTAADMALQQAQVTDDFFIRDNGYNTDGTTVYKIKIQEGNSFIEVPMYSALIGVGPTQLSGTPSPTDKQRMFEKIFKTSDFKDYATHLGKIYTPIAHLNASNNGIAWYKIPRIAQVGLDTVGVNQFTATIVDTRDIPVTEAKRNDILEDYHFNTSKRQGYIFKDGAKSPIDYYVTPISLGLTYFNPEVLSALFINNMDLLMRSKYSDNGKDLNSVEGGYGVLKGSTYTDLIDDSDISLYNPINDGKFTFVRGQEKVGSNGLKTYTGLLPKIEYKVIDMYDSNNNGVLTMLFGTNKEFPPAGVNTTLPHYIGKDKADYLKYLDKNVLDPITKVPKDKKLFVVAKVTFFADVIIPYTTPIMREFRGKVDPFEGNYLDLEHKNTSDEEGLSGNDYFTYTTYFAVAP